MPHERAPIPMPGPGPGESPEQIRAVRELCAGLFQQPQRIEQTLMHEIRDRFLIRPHQHRGVLQFDLIAGCQGHAEVDGQREAIHGLTLMVSYPQQLHGYELLPGAAPSCVYHLKLAVPGSWPFCRQRVCPNLLTGLGGGSSLIETMQQVVRLGAITPLPSLPILTALCSLLTRWPRSSTGRLPQITADMDTRLQRALQSVENRLGSAITVEQLARQAHLSPRHLARQFREQLGCTVHDYVNARRLSHARQRLLGAQNTVAHVARELGFSSSATFSRWFKQATGTTPSSYRADPHTM